MIFFYSTQSFSHKTRCINKNREDGRFLFISRRFEAKRLSRIKRNHNIHFQCSLSDPTPSQVPPVLKSTFKFRILTPIIHIHYTICTSTCNESICLFFSFQWTSVFMAFVMRWLFLMAFNSLGFSLGFLLNMEVWKDQVVIAHKMYQSQQLNWVKSTLYHIFHQNNFKINFSKYIHSTSRALPSITFMNIFGSKSGHL